MDEGLRGYYHSIFIFAPAHGVAYQDHMTRADFPQLGGWTE